MYVIGMNPWKEVLEFMEIREDVGANWLGEIQERCGKVLMQRGVFPPAAYFGQRSRPNRNAKRSSPKSAAEALRIGR